MRKLTFVLALVAVAGCNSTTSPSDGAVLDLARAADMASPGDAGSSFMIHVGPGGSMTFSPANLTVPVGATVTWVWDSSGHTVTSGTNCTADNKFCSPNDTNCGSGTLSSTGATYTHTFAAAGTFPYYCIPHCSLGMTGSILVQ